MAEELYFYSINEEQINKDLVSALIHENEYSYQNYIAFHYNEKDSIFRLDYAKVLDLIKEDIELLSQEDFWSIVNWCHWKNDKESNYELAAYGLESIYDISSKTPVRNFHEILWDYEALTVHRIWL